MLGSRARSAGTLTLSTPESSGRLSTSVRRYDIWDSLGNFNELQLVDSYLGNHGPIITHGRGGGMTRLQSPLCEVENAGNDVLLPCFII